MRFKPRYSLLTLLVLTALIAGGVKLWYGPHHVVEQTWQYAEEEYTYTRDLLGQKTKQGVHVMRYNQPTGIPEHVLLVYYRDGVITEQRWYINLNSSTKTYAPVYLTEGDEPRELQPQEQAELNQAVNREYQRWQARGYSLDESMRNWISNPIGLPKEPLILKPSQETPR